VLSDNTISYNNKYGIVLDHGQGWSSSNNSVSWNRFLGNNPNGTSQAYDEGLNNTFRYNYWDDWISPDVDDDGIVDVPYSIDGAAGNQDQFPLSTPLTTATIPENLMVGLIILAIIFAIIVIRYKQR
jgi:nitrous oxidase accessory protein NosD